MRDSIIESKGLNSTFSVSIFRRVWLRPTELRYLEEGLTPVMKAPVKERVVENCMPVGLVRLWREYWGGNEGASLGKMFRDTVRCTVCCIVTDGETNGDIDDGRMSIRSMMRSRGRRRTMINGVYVAL